VRITIYRTGSYFVLNGRQGPLTEKEISTEVGVGLFGSSYITVIRSSTVVELLFV